MPHLIARRAPQVLAALIVALSASATPALRAQDAAPAAEVGQTLELGKDVPSLLVLDLTSKVWSLQVSSQSKLDVQAGDIVVNSTHQGALWNTDGGSIKAAGSIRVAGGTTYLGRHSETPEPQTSAATTDDPVEPFRIQPGPMQTDQKLFLNNEEAITLRPGIYTDGIFATGQNSEITMLPGTYIMNGGDFFVSGARLKGEGVTIVMGGAQPGAFWCAAGAQLDLSAPTEGPLRSMVLVARARGGRGMQLDGARGQLKGLAYAPQATASLSAKSDVTLDRLICANLSLALSSRLRITGQDLTLQTPQDAAVDVAGDAR